MVYIGGSTATDLNISGALYVESGTATVGGTNICLENGTNCPADLGGANVTSTGSSTDKAIARWYGAGGLQIMINHGNGFVTLYAHHSAIYVKEGQSVTRGQPIGYMGSTGRATGTHLHFGVQRNGIWVNPLAYVPI